MKYYSIPENKNLLKYAKKLVGSVKASQNLLKHIVLCNQILLYLTIISNLSFLSLFKQHLSFIP